MCAFGSRRFIEFKFIVYADWRWFRADGSKSCSAFRLIASFSMHIIIFPWYQRLFLISPYHSRFWLLMPQFTFKIRSAHGSNSSGSISTYSTSIASMSSLPVLLRSIGSDSALGQRLSGSRLGCYARGFLFSEGRIVHLRRRDRGSWPYKAMRIVRVRFSQIHRIRVHRICWLTMIYSWRLHLNHQHFDGYIHKTRVLRYVSRGLCTKQTSLKNNEGRELEP